MVQVCAQQIRPFDALRSWITYGPRRGCNTASICREFTF